MLLAALIVLPGCHHRPPPPPVTAPLPTSSIPRDATRFSIYSTTDTTVVFRPFEVRWLRKGMKGHAVDPAQRDAIIARLTIVSVDTGVVVAKITGQISQVAGNHVVLIPRPHLSWWRDRHFWFGATTGAAIGALAFAVTQH